MMPEWLPALNASLILGSGIVLVAGRILIAQGKRQAHKRAMLSAATLATLFLIVYVTRAVLYGGKKFGHEGEMIRFVYLSLLVLHTLMSVIVIPPVWMAIARARRGDLVGHKAVAPYAFALWLFVAGSGWLVWWMLYHL